MLYFHSKLWNRNARDIENTGPKREAKSEEKHLLEGNHELRQKKHGKGSDCKGFVIGYLRNGVSSVYP
jgi:hypothetical protein